MQIRRWIALLVASVLAATACSDAPVAATSNPPTVGTARLGPPILAENQAVAAVVRFASSSRPELGEGKQIRNPQARLMTLEEWEDRFEHGRSYQDRSLPVWAVQVDGEWPQGGITPPEARRTYTYGTIVLDARTGRQMGASFRFERLALEDAEGLDPDGFARYPLQVSLLDAKDFAAFPVSEPGYLPAGFSLNRVTLDLTHPMQETLPYWWMPNQTAILSYSDRQGHEIQVAQSRLGQPHLISDAEPFGLLGMDAWRGGAAEGPTWVGWTATYPAPDGGSTYVTYILHSPDWDVATEVLQKIAESFPVGESARPTATPVPPYPTATPAPMPTPAHPIGPAAEIGKPYPFSLYVHCGVRQASFDGRDWIATPILRDGSGNPPPGWSPTYEQGTMMLVLEDLLRFTSSAGQTAEFRPLAPGEEYPWGPCA